jgi:hypothetical protein
MSWIFETENKSRAARPQIFWTIGVCLSLQQNIIIFENNLTGLTYVIEL